MTLIKWGYRRATKVIQKELLGSDSIMKLEYLKQELLVIVDYYCYGEILIKDVLIAHQEPEIKVYLNFFSFFYKLQSKGSGLVLVKENCYLILMTGFKL